jgi:beta-barrel assembly-enhancing protease
MRYRTCAALILGFLSGSLAHGQILGGIKNRIEQVGKVADKYRDLEITEAEEIKIGEDVSSRIRSRYGVVQDPDIHRYVSLTGAVVKVKSSRPALPFQFIVLDTDGVNAFAAPGGYIHITRGALSLMKNESELAGVLAHEIAHVTEKHTLRAIQKAKLVQMAADEKNLSSSPALFRRVADEAYKAVFAGFSREDELDADEHGLRTAVASGYAPSGLSGFLGTLNQRNANSQSQQGLFDSHPQMEERIQKLDALAKSNNWTTGVVAKERFTGRMKYQPVDPAKIALSADGAANLTGDTKKNDEESKKKSRFSLSNIKDPLSSKGSSTTTQSAEVTGSGGSRGLDRERGAVGGSNTALVPIRLTDAEVEQFKKEVNLKMT